LTDPTIAADCPEYPELLRQIEDYLLTSLIPWVESPSEQYRSTIAAYRSLKLSYRLTIVSGDGTSQGWRLSFSDGAVAIERVTANDVPRYGDIHTRIAASTLYRWIRNEIPYFMADFDCRRAGAVWDLGYTTAGSIVAKGMQSTCLVTAHLTADSRPLEAWYRKKVGDLNRNNDSEARRAS
jgi:hypothetical protein